jgi:hypothetical protein
MGDFNTGLKFNFSKLDGGELFNSASYILYISGMITCVSLLESIPSVKMSVSSSIDAESSIDSIASMLISIDSEITAQSAMEAVVSRLVSIVSSIDAESEIDAVTSAKLSVVSSILAESLITGDVGIFIEEIKGKLVTTIDLLGKIGRV